ncbi:MAG: hypothetical protein B7Y39_02985 [Bdellovibrio sp. 28-41-41]|nr:MAG: hypothetical protein B7Y39_02985 [Bdellovibrio sp. 28-41-41]
MTLTKLTDQNLDKNLKELVSGEREILAEIILQIIQPVWANGTNQLENLRLLCAGHNQEIYRWQANITRHH